MPHVWNAYALAQTSLDPLAVDRAIRALGQGNAFDEFLNAEGNEIFKREWEITPSINLGDPSVISALETGNFDVEAILLKIAGISE